jgi:hypothetical protein
MDSPRYTPCSSLDLVPIEIKRLAHSFASDLNDDFLAPMFLYCFLIAMAASDKAIQHGEAVKTPQQREKKRKKHSHLPTHEHYHYSS